MLRFLTAGESHGPELTAILEGMPAGLALDLGSLDVQMARRQKGYGSGGRMKIEKDSLRITAGFMNGQTTGAPIAVRIRNLDYAKWRERDIPPMTIPRPGHADLTGAVKYGYRELRLALERASAREGQALERGRLEGRVPDSAHEGSLRARLIERREPHDEGCSEVSVDERRGVARQKCACSEVGG